MEQHHTTEQDFQAKQLPSPNKKPNDEYISSFNKFQRWLQKIDGFKNEQLQNV